MKKVLLCLAVLVVFVIGWDKVLVPWINNWGITEEEKAMVLPGQDLVPNPPFLTNHAITIDAPPSKVWPWIVQFGGARGGWYSLTSFENLAGMGIYNTYEIHPEWQTFEKGHKLVYNKLGHTMIVPDVVPEKYFVMQTDTRKPYKGDMGSVYYHPLNKTIKLKEFTPYPEEGYEDYDAWWSWVFYLKELPGEKTRLYSRFTADWTRGKNALVDFVMLNSMEVPHAIMDIEMLKQIKAVSEGKMGPQDNTPKPPFAGPILETASK